MVSVGGNREGKGRIQEPRIRRTGLRLGRVLDLTDRQGFLCGKILGDLGADVVKVERPGGDSARNTGPFHHDLPDPEKSLVWFAYNTSKRGITLNIESSDGRQIFKRLAQEADFVLDSFAPGCLQRLGLGYSVLSELNPRLIMVSISHFGQAGPWRDYAACDLVCMALGGLMYITGDLDRPPVCMPCEQAYCHASTQAALGAMLAHYHRLKTGEGQFIDVSIQESVARTLYTLPVLWEFERRHERRHGGQMLRGGVLRRWIWPCKDGYVTWLTLFGIHGAGEWQAMAEWMKSENMAGKLTEVNWVTVDFAKLSQEQLNSWEDVVTKFFQQHTKSELNEAAPRWGVKLRSIDKPEEVVANEQLAARGFWVKLPHPELGTNIMYPGAFFKSDYIVCRPRFRAPLIGEHNYEIYQGELGFSKQEILRLKEAGVI